MSVQRTINAEEFEKDIYRPGTEGIVATTKVPDGHVWRVENGRPIVIGLPHVQTFTVDEGVNNQVIDLDPNAPKVPYADNWASGEYTEDAYIVAYDVSGSEPELITDSTTVQFNGTFTEDGGFVESFEVDETSGNSSTKSIEVWAYQWNGVTTIQKRNSGKQNKSQTLQTETNVGLVFQEPYDPNSDKRLKFEGISGKKGVLPPGFSIDVVYYDEQNDVELVDAESGVYSSAPPNTIIDIPISQRKIKSDESPKQLRRSIEMSM